MDSDYILDDFPTDHHELPFTAAEIEAIGSGYVSPAPDADAPQHEEEQHQHEHQQENEPINHDIHAIDHGYDDGDFLPDPHYPPEEGADGQGTEGDEAGPSRRNGRSKAAEEEMSAEEKKRKAREANKKAAEKSRAKKRKQLNNTEEQVIQLRRENERLRARLQSLRSTAGPSSPSTGEPSAQFGLSMPDQSYHHGNRSLSRSASPSTLDPNDIGIDRAYCHKLAVELVGAKISLLEKHFELERIRGGEENEEVETARRELVGKYASVSVLKAEDAAMKAVLKLLGNETIELGGRKRALAAELKRRGGAVGTQPPAQAEEAPMETDEATEEELKRTQEEEAASHTQVLAQAVRDVAMGEARGMEGHPEDNGVEKDVYGLQPYIEQVMSDWPEQHDPDH